MQTKFITTPRLARAVIRKGKSIESEKITSLSFGSPVGLIRTEGTRSEVCFCFEDAYASGWTNTAYLGDTYIPEPVKPVETEPFIYKLNKYNDTFEVTAADAHKTIGKRHTIGWMLIDKRITKHRISPSIIEIIEAAEDYFGGVAEYADQEKKSVFAFFRTKETNGGATGSAHLKGYAADFRILLADKSYVPTATLAEFTERHMYKKGWRGGIGVYSATCKHIHVDLRGKWTYWWVKTSGSKTPGFGGRPVVFTAGNRSPAIKKLQEYLNKQGYACGTPDGSWGSKTSKAFIAWQKSRGLKGDNKFGKDSNKVAKLFDW